MIRNYFLMKLLDVTEIRPNEAPKTCEYLLKNEYNYSDIKDILKNDIDFASDISSSPDMKAHLSAILVGRMMKELN